MARARNIKPAIMDNEELADLDPLARLLFIYLWMLADRDGRMEDRPKRIAAQALPYDRSADVDAMLSDLHKAGFIHRYEVDGIRVIQITSFLKHQSPHGTEKDGELPDVNGAFTVHKRGRHGCVTGEPLLDNGEPTVRQRCVNGGLTVNSPLLNALNHDLLIPDSLIPDSAAQAEQSDQADEGDQPPKAAGKPAAHQRGTRLPDDWFLPQHWGQWAMQKFAHFTAEIVRDEADKFANHWRAKTGRDASKRDWYATWQNWCMSDICQRAHPPPSRGSETDYQRSMRERVEQAAGVMAHIVAAKPPGTQTKPPWEVAFENASRAAAIGMD